MEKSIFKNLWHKSLGSGNPLFVLLGLNVLIFVVFGALQVMVSFGWIPQSFGSFLSRSTELPAAWGQFLAKPWTLLTYMFVHHDFFHLLFNLLWLYWMGRIFLDFFSRKLFLRTYFAGGVLGGIVFLILFPLIPTFSQFVSSSYLVGASAAVSAIVLSLAVLLPNYSIHMLFLGRVPLKYLALAFIVLDLLSLGGGNPGGSLAHLGGGLAGVFLALVEKGSIRLPDLKRFKGKSRKLKVVHSEKDRATQKNPSGTLVNQADIDKILDKISKSGYDKLTAEEKELLFKASKTELKD